MAGAGSIVSILAIAIIAMAAFMVFRGFMAFGRTADTVHRIFDVALRNAERQNRDLSSNPDDPSEDTLDRITCQFCGSAALATRTQCKNCGAPLA